MEIGGELGDEGEVGNIYRNMGFAYSKTGLYGKENDCFRRASEIAKDLGEKGEVKRSAFNRTGLYNRAIDCYPNALKMTEDLYDKEVVRRTYCNLEDLYRVIHKYDKEIEYFGKVLEFPEELDDKVAMQRISKIMGVAYNDVPEKLGNQGDMGNTWKNIKNYLNNSSLSEEAIYCQRKALDIAEKLGEKREVEHVST